MVRFIVIAIFFNILILIMGLNDHLLSAVDKAKGMKSFRLSQTKLSPLLQVCTWILLR